MRHKISLLITFILSNVEVVIKLAHLKTKRKKEASKERKMNKLPVSGRSLFELVAADSPAEGEDTIASAAYLVLNNAPGLLT